MFRRMHMSLQICLWYISNVQMTRRSSGTSSGFSSKTNLFYGITSLNLIWLDWFSLLKFKLLWIISLISREAFRSVVQNTLAFDEQVKVKDQTRLVSTPNFFVLKINLMIFNFNAFETKIKTSCVGGYSSNKTLWWFVLLIKK